MIYLLKNDDENVYGDDTSPFFFSLADFAP